MLNTIATQHAIKAVRSRFHAMLERDFGLVRVSAPLVVTTASGENDQLNGTERPVSFDAPGLDTEVQIVQSLAKWKRVALGRYGFEPGQGLFTEMNAIRRDEELDNLHSIYVDQWDWERVITPEERRISTLTETAQKIYTLLRKLAVEVGKEFEQVWVGGYAPGTALGEGSESPHLPVFLPEKLFVISQRELAEMYPDLNDKECENEICRVHGAVLLTQIGENGDRAPDYDDWSLNGDIMLYYPPLDCALEISSMGVRVDAAALQRQCEARGVASRLALPYHRAILEKKIPQTIGGGLGQSRICMYLLGKKHIGEVQASLWPDEILQKCAEEGIHLL